MYDIVKCVSTVVVVFITVGTRLNYLDPFLPVTLIEKEDPVFDILDPQGTFDCPGNFSVHLLTDGVYFYHLQTSVNSKGLRNVARCEMTTAEPVARGWAMNVPEANIQIVVQKDHEALVRNTCKKYEYIIKRSPALAPHEILKSRTGKENIQVHGTNDGLISEDSPLLDGTVPGTLWCGFGNTANNAYDALGEKEDIDKCCRTYDLCRPIIGHLMTKDQVKNVRVFPVSHCSCDLALYNCFRNINTTEANEIARLYFNFARMRCFNFQLNDMCVESWLGMCWRKDWKCTAVIKDNPLY